MRDPQTDRSRHKIKYNYILAHVGYTGKHVTIFIIYGVNPFWRKESFGVKTFFGIKEFWRKTILA